MYAVVATVTAYKEGRTMENLLPTGDYRYDFSIGCLNLFSCVIV